MCGVCRSIRRLLLDVSVLEVIEGGTAWHSCIRRGAWRMLFKVVAEDGVVLRFTVTVLAETS